MVDAMKRVGGAPASSNRSPWRSPMSRSRDSSRRALVNHGKPFRRSLRLRRPHLFAFSRAALWPGKVGDRPPTAR